MTATDDANRYLERIRSAVQSDMSRPGVGEFALSLVRQIANDAHDAGEPEFADHAIADLAAKLSRESLDAGKDGRTDWSEAYERIHDVLMSWHV